MSSISYDALSATTVPGRIEAENYDTGGEGVGYSTRRADWGNAKPRKDAMDIGADRAASGGYAIGWTAAGQWFSYTISVATAGDYSLGFVVGTPWGSALHVTVDGVEVTGAVALPTQSGGYHTVSSKTFNMKSGTHQLVVRFDASLAALDAIDVRAVASAVPQTVTLHGHTFTLNPALSDEFNASALDKTKWLSTYNGGVQRLNDEWECFTDDGTRAMTGSSLALTAKKTGKTHAAATCAAPNYQSGLIRSAAQQKYGYFSAALKLPAGAGMWPAFWLIPGPTAENEYSPPWPPEIDIMEMVNNGREGPFQISEFVHGCGTNLDQSLVNSWGNYPSARSALSFADGAFHTFAAEWTPTQIYLYVDGKFARSYAFDWDKVPPGGETSLLDPTRCAKGDNGTAEVIIDLALGGQWAGDIDDAALPQRVEIDYVRSYRY